MLNSILTGQFKRDYKRFRKEGKDMTLLRELMDMILCQEPLPAAYRDHPLKGRYKGWRECHIESDWLLVYRKAKGQVTFGRLGTHAELF